MKTIKTEGESQIVEFTQGGKLKRVILPLGETNTRLGIPYGLPFEKFIKNKQIPQELRKRGIWTLNDLLNRPKAALGAIQAAYGQDLATIIRLARKETGGKNG